jgi:hypothetical protein
VLLLLRILEIDSTRKVAQLQQWDGRCPTVCITVTILIIIIATIENSGVWTNEA